MFFKQTTLILKTSAGSHDQYKHINRTHLENLIKLWKINIDSQLAFPSKFNNMIMCKMSQ